MVFFLRQFTEMDCSDIACQKRLVKTFLNSVFVYDDKVIFTFHYSGNSRTMTLHELDDGSGHSIRIPSTVVHQIIKATLLEWLLLFPKFLNLRFCCTDCALLELGFAAAATIQRRGQRLVELP